jgi:hypothetical protein
VACVLATAAVEELQERDVGEPEGIVEFTVDEQATVRSGPGTAEFELDPAVRLVADVEQVANHRHEADERVEAEVAEHAREHPARRSKPPGLLDDLAAGRAGCGVADPGDEADDAVGPEPEARARQPVALVEPIGETLDPLQRCPGLRTDARCRRPPMARLGARRSMAHAGCQYREKTAERRWHAGLQGRRLGSLLAPRRPHAGAGRPR